LQKSSNVKEIKMTRTRSLTVTAGHHLAIVLLASVSVLSAQSIGTWSSLPSGSYPRSQPQGGVINGVLYVAGGANASGDVPYLESYNPATESWSTLAQLPNLGGGDAGRYQGAAGVINGKLYLAGGWRTSPALPTSSLEIYDPVANAWSQGASMPALTGCSGADVIDGLLYVVSSCNGFSGYVNSLYVYNPATNAWSTGASMPHVHSQPAVAAIGGILYVAGGFDGSVINNTLDAYNPATNSWTTLAGMPTARGGAASAVINGLWYVAGGSNASGSPLSVVEVYDAATNTWSTSTPMFNALAGSYAGGVAGQLYVADGSNAGGATSALEVYNPGVGAWSPLPSGNFSRSAVQGGVINGMLYVAGGQNASGDVPYLESYNPVTESWSTLAQLPNLGGGDAGRYQGAAGVINGKLYLAGGWRTSPALPTSSLEIYDPSVNAWTQGASMPALAGCSGADVIGGLLYVVSACNGFSGYVNSLYVYNPANNTWTTGTAMPHVHSSPAVAAIGGILYVAGGFDGSVINNTLDAYNPATNTWTTLASMPTARQSAASAAVNGFWYVAGGNNASGAALSVVEAYNPATNTWATVAPMLSAMTGSYAGAAGGLLYVADGSNNSGGAAALEVYTPGTVQGSGVVTLSFTSLSFGSQNLGTSTLLSEALTNTGTAAVGIASITITGADSADYAETNTCGSSLAIGASCEIFVTFTPTAPGTRTASVSIADNAGSSPQTIGLTGTGAPLMVTLSATSLSFASQELGTVSGRQSVTVTNTGTAVVSIASITITGADTADYAQTNNCLGVLAAGANCGIFVTFTPTAPDTRVASISIADNASNSPQTISLTGTGAPPMVALSATSLSFASQFVGTVSAAQSVTVTNTGTAVVSIASITITGADSADYAQTNNCLGVLAAGANCGIFVTFTPTATGTRVASISIADNAGNSPQTISLTGTGAPFMLTLSATSLSFASQFVGTVSAAQSVTVTNGGTAAVGVSITITGANIADYAQTNGCGSVLAAGATCGIFVTFTPTATGARTASISVADNASNSPQTISLAGTGASLVVTLSATSLAFGSQFVGTISGTQSVTVTNTGTAAVSVASISIAGTNSADYAQTSTCGSSLAAGASCGIFVTFTPTAAGARMALISILDNASNSPQTISLTGTGQLPGPTISSNGIVNAASFEQGVPVAPGSIVAIFGANLAADPASAGALPLPTSLGGAQVLMNGIKAPLFYASAGQINAQVPWEVSGATSLSVQVAYNGATSNTASVALATAAPGVFVIVHAADYSPVTSSNPAVPGEFLVLFCTGLGPVSNQPATGTAAQSSLLSVSSVATTVTIAGVPSFVAFSGLTPGLVGVYQVNVQVPAGTYASSGSVLLAIYEGQASSINVLPVQP
jgi:uncharacterized protein (TIGR03437 family)